MVGILIFAGIILLSLGSIFFAFYNWKYSIDENKKYIKKRSIGLLILSVGLIIHTLGDFLSPLYGSSLELGLESIAHVIILVSFIFFISSSKEILNGVKGYWFK